MCIRDSRPTGKGDLAADDVHLAVEGFRRAPAAAVGVLDPCLLYTSDAADERSSVDLGGRRIIKKKTKQSTRELLYL